MNFFALHNNILPMDRMYVIQVETTNEHLVANECKNLILIDREEAFVPICRREQRRAGQLIQIEKVMFPGYVFLVTAVPEDLFLRLKKVPRLTKMLRVGDDIMPISEKEEDVIRRLINKEHIVEMSRGYIKGDKVVVEEGPLVGLEGIIKQINRHKRTAKIELQLEDKTINVIVGLEIVSKTE